MRELNAAETSDKETVWKHVCKLILVKQFTVSTRQALVYKHSCLLSPAVIIAHPGDLKVLAKFGVSQCSQNLALLLAIAWHLAIAVMIRSW